MNYRNEILEIINGSYEHLKAEEVYKKMKDKGSKIVLATVYNNLNKLSEEGLIKKIVIEGETDRYDRAERHDHLVCENCGELSDIRFKDLTSVLKKQMDSDLISYDLKVYYLCPNCRKKLKNR